MVVKVILALSLSLFFISEVSSDLKTNQETNHVFNRGGEAPGGRKLLMDNIVLHFSKYFLNRPISHALAPAPAPALGYHLDCGGLCKNRCSLHSRQNVCIRACGTCCIRCKCVPPGTFGNREMCGKCYTYMTTHGNRTKCP